MKNYSALQLAIEGLKNHTGWERAWGGTPLRKTYDVIIVGGGGHGLATAYYLARNHGVKNIAVLEKGWIGGGNSGRNTTIVRSNYMIGGNTDFYEWSMQLWENLSRDLNFNVMLSQRGHIALAHSPAQMDGLVRRANTMIARGIDAEILSREALQKEIPYLDYSDAARYPIHGCLIQRRAGVARHDAVVWGYARAASRLGVDIIEGCEVTDFLYEGERVCGVTTSRGDVHAGKVGLAIAGSTTLLARKAHLELPIESHVLQAFVTESIKPLIDKVLTFGTASHCYISQSDHGGLVFGGDLDGYNSYAQRGGLSLVEAVVEAVLSMVPSLSRLRVLRGWGGLVDMTMDGSPIIDRSPVDGLYLNCGWNYLGFKATPASGWTYAHLLATERSHDLSAAYALDRFRRGDLVNEAAAGPYPWLH